MPVKRLKPEEVLWEGGPSFHPCPPVKFPITLQRLCQIGFNGILHGMRKHHSWLPWTTPGEMRLTWIFCTRVLYGMPVYIPPFPPKAHMLNVFRVFASPPASSNLVPVLDTPFTSFRIWMEASKAFFFRFGNFFNVSHMVHGVGRINSSTLGALMPD